MKAGVDDHPVVGPDLQAVLGTGGFELFGHDDVPNVLAHAGGVALGGVPFFFKLVLQVAHIHDDAGADAAAQGDLR